MVNAEIVYCEAFSKGLKPDSFFTVSEWSDKHRVLPQKASSEPGRWRTSRTPYLKDILDCLSPNSPIERVVLMKGAQLGGTECGNNWIGYVIHVAPGPMMMVQPTVETAKRWSRQRLAPMIEETPALKGIVKEPRERDSGNTILSKEFLGGVIIITGANSAVGLRSMPVKYLFLDEVDGYPSDVEGEGSPISLAEKRTDTFSRKKIFLVSTPGFKGISNIEREYEASDQRRYYVPCPHCQEMQYLKWGQITFNKNDLSEGVFYRCEHCNKLINEHHKTWMLENGEWIAENPVNGKVAGFHLSSLYSPIGWKSWENIVKEFLQAKKDKNLLKTWVNTVLGETWEEEGETISEDNLFNRRESYGPDIPMDAGILTAAVDTQDDRLEVEVIAWGKGEESWSIDWRAFHGNPAKDDVWNDLDEYLQRKFRHESGAILKILITCIDTGGHHTKKVYEFVKPRQARRVFAIKGSNQTGAALVGRPSISNSGRVKLFPVGVTTAKDSIFARLKIEEFGSGYMHFPSHYDQEYFRQLTAEKIVTKYRKGFPYREYMKVRARNEALDLRVYNMAALAILNPNLEMIVNAFKASFEKGEDYQPIQPISRGRRVLSRGI